MALRLAVKYIRPARTRTLDTTPTQTARLRLQGWNETKMATPVKERSKVVQRSMLVNCFLQVCCIAGERVDRGSDVPPPQNLSPANLRRPPCYPSPPHPSPPSLPPSPPLPSLLSLQVLGTGAGEVSPSLLLFTDTQRYLFNCGENMQRLCNEHHLRLRKLSNVFLTRTSWTNLGGELFSYTPHTVTAPPLTHTHLHTHTYALARTHTHTHARSH